MRLRMLTAITFILLFAMAQASFGGCSFQCDARKYETGSEASCISGRWMSSCAVYYDCMGGYCDVWCDGDQCVWT